MFLLDVMSPESSARVRRRARGQDGLTLLEMIIVISIISILAMIALPRISGMIGKANEGATIGKLGVLRKSLTIYYVDNDGQYPSDLAFLMQPGSKYMSGTAAVFTASHGSKSSVVNTSTKAYADDGSWGYANSGADWGQVWVRCTHTDARGKVWTSY